MQGTDNLKRTLKIGTDGESNLRALKNRINDVSDELRGVVGPAEAASRGTGKVNRRMKDLATSSGTASAGLTSLQANLAATRVAQESLRDETGSLEDALSSLQDEGQEPAAKKAIEAITSDIQGSVSEVNELDNELGEFLDGLDEDELETFFAGFTDVNGVFDSDEISFDADENLTDIGRGFASIEEQADVTRDQLVELDGALSSLHGDTAIEDGFDIADHDIDRDLFNAADGIEDFWNVRSVRDQFEDAGFEDIHDIAGAEGELFSLAPRDFDFAEEAEKLDTFQESADQIIDTALPDHVDSLSDVDVTPVEQLDMDGIHEDIQEFVEGSPIHEDAFAAEGFENIQDIADADDWELSGLVSDDHDDPAGWIQEVSQSAEQLMEQTDYIGDHDDLFGDVLDVPSLDPEDHFGKGTSGKLADDLGIHDIREVAQATTDDLTELYGVGDATADDMLSTAQEAVQGYEAALENVENVPGLDSADDIDDFVSPLESLEGLEIDTFWDDIKAPLDQLDPDDLPFDEDALAQFDDAGFDTLLQVANSDRGDLLDTLADGIDDQGLARWARDVSESAEALEQMDPFDVFPGIFNDESQSVPIEAIDDTDLDDGTIDALQDEFDTVGDVINADDNTLSEVLLGGDHNELEELTPEDAIGDTFDPDIWESLSADLEEEYNTAGQLLTAEFGDMEKIAKTFDLGTEMSDTEAAVDDLLQYTNPARWSSEFNKEDWGDFYSMVHDDVATWMEDGVFGGAGVTNANEDGVNLQKWVQANEEDIREKLTEKYSDPKLNHVIPDDADGQRKVPNLKEVEEELYDNLYDESGEDLPDLDSTSRHFDPDGVRETLEETVPGLDPDQAKQRIQDSVGDDDVAENLTNLVDLMDANEEIKDAILSGDSVDDVLSNIDDLDSKNIRELYDALDEHGASLRRFMGDSSDFVDNLGQFDSKADLQKAVDTELGDVLDQYQTDVLSDVLMNIQDTYTPGNVNTIGEDMALTRDTVEMGLLQQYMDTESQGRRDQIQNILGRLHSGDLGFDRDQSILNTDTYLGIGDTAGEVGTISEDLNARLEDYFPEDTAQELTEETVGEISTRDGIDSMADLLGEGRSGDITNIAGEAFEAEDFAEFENVTQIVGEELEKSLQDTQLQVADRIAPGLSTGLRGTDDYNLSDALFGSSLSPGDDDALPEYLDNIQEMMKEVDRVQEAAQFSRGLGYGKNRGLVGYALYGADTALSRRNMNTPRRMATIRNSLEAMSESYSNLLPLLDATSLNIGALNVSFESMGVMLFKLTAMFGPVITGLLGLASAGLTALSALGALTAVGAIGFLQQMEDEMAGVNDRGEAMEELMGTIRDMAWQATQPLQEVRLADGRSGIQLFVDTLRGGLILLNRMSAVLAHLASLDVFSEELDKFTDALFNTDGVWLESLESSLEDVLPLIRRMTAGFINSLPGFIEFASEIAGDLGPQIVDTLGNISSALGLMTEYGAGFMKMALFAISAVGQVIGVLVVVIDALINLLLKIPVLGGILGVFGEDANDFAYILGGLVGAIEVTNRVVGFMIARFSMALQVTYGLYRASRYLTKQLYAKTVALYTAEKGMYAYARAAVVAAAKIAILFGALLVIADALGLLNEESEAFLDTIPILGDYSNAWTTLANVVLVAASAVIFFNKVVVTALVSLGLISAESAIAAGGITGITAAIKGLGSAIAGSSIGTAFAGLASALGISVGALAALVAMIIIGITVLADFIYYLKTGNSVLGNYIPKLELAYDIISDMLSLMYDIAAPWREANNVLDRMITLLEKLDEFTIIDIGGAPDALREYTTEGEDKSRTAKMVDYGTNLATSPGETAATEARRIASSGSGGGSSGSSPMSIEIINNGYLGPKDFGRMVKRELRDLRGTDSGHL